MDRLRELIHEIHRRSLWQVLGIYVVASWAVLGGVGTLGDVLGLPEWFSPLALGLLIVGLPIGLATAFVQEGIGRGSSERGRDDAHAGRSTASALFTWRNALLGGVAAFGLWGAIATALLLRQSSMSDTGPWRSIAVIPFENLSVEEENEFFTIGLQDEILTQLQRISDLHLISRSSVMRFQPGPDRASMRVIGEELQARGSVQRAGEELRINIQLIDAATDGHLWAEVYEGDLTVQRLLGFQGQIAQRVAESLEATILPGEAARIAAVPTESTQAYDEYLRGRYFWNRRTAESLRSAIEHFERAVSLDPTYASAYAGLADTYAVLPWWVGSRRDELEDAGVKGMAAAERAITLALEAPEAHASLGYLQIIGLYDLDAGEAGLRRALELEPLSIIFKDNLGGLLRFDRQYEEATTQIRQALEIEPGSATRWARYSVALMLSDRTEEAADVACSVRRAHGRRCRCPLKRPYFGRTLSRDRRADGTSSRAGRR